jgi:hypothetical protein
MIMLVLSRPSKRGLTETAARVAAGWVEVPSGFARRLVC